MKDIDSGPARPAEYSTAAIAFLCAALSGGCAHGPAAGPAGSSAASAPAPQAAGAGSAGPSGARALSVRPSGSAVGSPASPASGDLAKGRADLDQAIEALRGVSVYFRPGEAALSPDAEDGLAAVGMVLARHPELGVEVETSGDALGPWRSADELARVRSEASHRYLVKMGARDKQVGTARAEPKGAQQPDPQTARKY